MISFSRRPALSSPSPPARRGRRALPSPDAVLIVCTGNVCRSAYASRALQGRLAALAPGRVEVGSAGSQPNQALTVPPPLVRLGAEAGDQLLVALDESGAVLGYTRSGPFKDRPAYATTRETSLYVDERARGQGVGGALYAELLQQLDGVGLRLAVAGVAQPNPASDRLHRAHGFVEVGTFRNVGVKLGRAWDVRWYQRPLRP